MRRPDGCDDATDTGSSVGAGVQEGSNGAEQPRTNTNPSTPRRGSFRIGRRIGAFNGAHRAFVVLMLAAAIVGGTGDYVVWLRHHRNAQHLGVDTGSATQGAYYPGGTSETASTADSRTIFISLTL